MAAYIYFKEVPLNHWSIYFCFITNALVSDSHMDPVRPEIKEKKKKKVAIKSTLSLHAEWPVPSLQRACWCRSKNVLATKPCSVLVLLPLLSSILMTASEISCQVYSVFCCENLQFQLYYTKILKRTGNLTIVKSHKVEILSCSGSLALWCRYDVKGLYFSFKHSSRLAVGLRKHRGACDRKGGKKKKE